MEDIKIIDNTKEARENYGHLHGSTILELTQEQLDAIKDGKCLAWNDGEYSKFIVLKK